VTFFKRFFSADFRRAVAAEAAGDYNEAARAYALAGEQAKVAEMHLLRAERATSPEGKLQELRAAVRWADPAEPEGRAARRRIARALFNWARASGLVSESDRQVVREAAALFVEAGDDSGAGECHELIGDELAAAEAYQRAGDLEKLESVLQREEGRRRHAQRVTDAYDEYKLHLAAGERDLALAAIRLCVDESPPADKAGYRQKLEALEQRLITDGTVILRHGGRETRYVGVFPLTMGREPICQVVLRDVGISRAHVEIKRAPGGFALTDLQSLNGTTLAGVAVSSGATLPIADGAAGELGVGKHCVMRYEAARGALKLEVLRGLDRGVQIVASAEPIAVEGAELRFVDGRPRLKPLQGAIDLNGVHAGGAVQLCHGDRVELSRDRAIEVV
jgi:tetratricopeptide (TPR) repeat protein